MVRAGVLVMLVATIAGPVTARPVLQPFGGRAILSYLPGTAESCDERVLLTIRNVGPAGVVYRFLWFDANHILVGRSEPRHLEPNVTIQLQGDDVARSCRVVCKRGDWIEVRWASERFSRITTAAALVKNRDHGQKFEVVNPIPVDDEPPRPIRWAEYQAIARP